MTEAEANIVVMHMMRDEKFCHDALEKCGDENVFDAIRFPIHAIIWEILADINKTAPDEVTSQLAMEAELENRAAELEDDEYHQAEEFVERVHQIDAVKFALKTADMYLNAALVDKTKADMILKLDGLFTSDDIGRTVAGAVDKISNLTEIKEQAVNPFMDIDQFMDDSPREPVGVDIWDKVSGGFLPGEAVLLLGPTGGGKTTLAIQTAAARAKEGKDVALFLYEQKAKGDVMERFCCHFLDEPVDTFRSKKISEWPKDVLERYEALKEKIGPHLHIVDFANKEAKGDGGMMDVWKAVRRLQDRSGRKLTAVFLDWLLPQIYRYLAFHGKEVSNETIRSTAFQFVDQGSQMAQEMGLTWVLNHQLDTKTARQSPNIRPRVTDAMEVKSLGFNMDAAFLIGTRGRENNIGYFLADKQRRGALNEVLYRFDGKYMRFLDAGEDYTLDHNGRIAPLRDELNSEEEYDAESKKARVNNLYT